MVVPYRGEQECNEGTHGRLVSKVLWQLSPVKAQLRAGPATSWQNRPEQHQLEGLSHSMQSLCPAAGNGHVLFLGYGAQGLGCRSTPLGMCWKAGWGSGAERSTEAQCPLI